MYKRGNIKLFFGNDPSLAGYWRLNGNARDESRNGNHGTENGGVLPYWGRFGGGYKFDGSNDYIHLKNSTIIANKPNVTILAWIMWDGTIGDRAIYDESDALGTVFRCNKNANHYLQFDILTSTGWHSTNNTEAISPNQLYFVACTLSSIAGMKVFVCGKIKGSNTNTLPCDRTIANAWIGQFQQAGFNFSGVIFEVAVFERAVFPIEIQNYYKWAIGQDKKYPTYFFAPLSAPPPVTFDALLLVGD